MPVPRPPAAPYILGWRRRKGETLLQSILMAIPLLLLLSAPQPVPAAAEHVVRTITEDERGRFRFEPAMLRIRRGDTVRFVPDARLHGVKSIPGMIPDGARPWWSAMGEVLVLRFEVPGVYGYKCPSHYGMGMVGLIVVDDPTPNLDAARRVAHPPAAARVFARLFARLAE